jgi:integrase
MNTAPPSALIPEGFVLDEPKTASECPTTVYVKKLKSTQSKTTMAGCLARIADLITDPERARDDGTPPVPAAHCAWWTLRYAHTIAIRDHLSAQTNDHGDPWAPAYVNKHLVAIRQILLTSRRLGHMSAEDWLNTADLEKVDGSREPAGRAVGEDEIANVLRVCVADDSPAGIRDAALIAYLAITGCRRAEAAGARRSNYNPANRTTRFIGKGDKERTSPLNEHAAIWLNRWLALVPSGPGPLFRPIHWSGQIRDRAMSPAAIEHILTKRCDQAKTARFTPHDLRRTWVSNMLGSGADLVLAQKGMGHAAASTTARYDRRGDADLAAAVERLWFPPPAEFADHSPAGQGD